MMRSVNQIRPQGDPNAVAYSPHRDVAHIFLPMMKEVFCGLDETHWPPYFRKLFEHEKITQDDLAETVTVFTEAIRLFIRDREVNNPFDAFQKAGLQERHDAVRFALFALIGQVITGGFFVAIRDVTMQGHESPCAHDMASMVAAGRDFVTRLHGRWANYDISSSEQLTVEVEELRRLVAQLNRLRDEDANIIAAQRREITDNKLLVAAAKVVKDSKGWAWFRAVWSLCWRLWKGTL